MLVVAEPYFREFAVEVWQTEAAHSKRYEFLIHRVRSSPQLPYVIAHRWRPWRVPVIALEWTALVAGRKQRDNKHDYR